MRMLSFAKRMWTLDVSSGRLVFNAGETATATLPETLPGHRWQRVIDTSGQPSDPVRSGAVQVAPNSVVALELCPIGGTSKGGQAMEERKVKA